MAEAMELREFAELVILSESIEQKIARPTAEFTDKTPGPPLLVERPTRPANLQFAARRTAPVMPKPQALAMPGKRAVAHHIMANNELQALEVMAMILLRFPEAAADFRLGLVEIMLDEQRHTRMHIQRAAELGLSFGDLPVNSYIWAKATEYQNVLQYIAGLPLVFEGANLDHSAELEDCFLRHNDKRSAAIMRAIHRDEIGHVQFGMDWLRKLKDPELSDFYAWQQALHLPIRPKNARGDSFQREARLAAGMDPEFVDQLIAWQDEPEST